jgi:hypothetical protein
VGYKHNRRGALGHNSAKEATGSTTAKIAPPQLSRPAEGSHNESEIGFKLPGQKPSVKSLYIDFLNIW